MDCLKRLEAMGFRRVGCWSLVSAEPVFDLESGASAGDVLYAFVSGRAVLYVGKTTRSLHQRMYGYQRPGATQRTNSLARARISALLGSGQPLDIYALCSGGNLQQGTFKLNLAAALEDGIIRELQPPWNKLGK